PSGRSRGAERGQFCRISTVATGGREKPGNGIFAPKTARAAARARLRCPLADQTHSKLRNGGDARRRPSPLGGNAWKDQKRKTWERGYGLAPREICATTRSTTRGSTDKAALCLSVIWRSGCRGWQRIVSKRAAPNFASSRWCFPHRKTGVL